MRRLLALSTTLGLLTTPALAQATGVAPIGGGSGIPGPLTGDVQTQGATGQTTYANASGAPYVAGRYYLAGNITPASAAGLAGSATKMACYPGTVNKLATVSSLAATLTTISAAGNVQFAIYTDAGGRPNALVANSSASGSTTTAGPVSTNLTVAAGYTTSLGGAATASGSVQLGPQSAAGKELWWCAEGDNATAIFAGTSNVAGTGASYIGSATLANVTSQSTEIAGLTTTSTFGTWPASLSGVTWTDSTGRSTPLIGFMIGSVP